MQSTSFNRVTQWGDIRAQGLNLSLVGHEDNLRFSHGLGLQFDLKRSWAVRSDWDRYRFQ